MIEKEKKVMNFCIKNIHIDMNDQALELDISVQVQDIIFDINGILVIRDGNVHNIQLPRLASPNSDNRLSITFDDHSIWLDIKLEIIKELKTMPWVEKFFSNDE